MSEEIQSPLIPLAAAAIIVHKEATGQIATHPEALDPVAASIAKHVPIYAREGYAKTIELVRPHVLEAAVFRDCGKIMRSRDVPYKDLCMRRGDLAVVIEKLAGPDPQTPED